VKRVALGMVLLLSGCAPLVVEQRAVKLDTEVRAIHTDFSALSATFTPEQSAKYAHAKAAQDDPTFQEFYTSLNAQQQATMKTLLARAQQVEQEKQQIVQEVRQDLRMRHRLRHEMPDVSGFIPSGGI
jgi:hypothetical protein